MLAYHLSGLAMPHTLEQAEARQKQGMWSGTHLGCQLSRPKFQGFAPVTVIAHLLLPPARPADTIRSNSERDLDVSAAYQPRLHVTAGRQNPA